MLLSAVSVLVVAQSSSEISEGLMNNPVYTYECTYAYVLYAKKLYPMYIRTNVRMHMYVCEKLYPMHSFESCVTPRVYL